ncbi:MAG: peptidoglycan DD-metalloendopeptidase family protein [Bacteroidota bacterium]
MSQLVKNSLYLLFVLLFSFSAFSQSKKELEKKKQKIQKDIEMTNELLNTTQKNKKTSLNQLATLEKKITLRQDLITTINQEVAAIEREVEENSIVIQRLSSEIDKLKKEYAQMIVFAHKNQSSYSRLMFLFSAKDFNQAYQRAKYFQQYAQYRQHQALLITKSQKNLTEKINVLIAKKQQKQALLGNKQQEKELMESEKVEKEEMVAQLGKKEQELRADLKKKQQDNEKLNKAIQKIIADEIEKSRREAEKAEAKRLAAANKAAKETPSKTKTTPAETKTTSKTPVKETTSDKLNLTPEAKLVSNNFETNKAKLPWPVADGVITSYFGEHDHPVLKGVKIKNNGIDIATRNGAQVRSVFDGEVTGVINIPGAGKAIIVRHGEYLTVYSNLADAYVQKGDKISTKQNIGLAQAEDDSNKAEMHFEIWQGSTLLNPIGWIYRNN